MTTAPKRTAFAETQNIANASGVAMRSIEIGVATTRSRWSEVGWWPYLSEAACR